MRRRRHWDGGRLLCSSQEGRSQPEDPDHRRKRAVHRWQEGWVGAVLFQQCLGVCNPERRSQSWRSRQGDHSEVGAHMEEDWRRRSTGEMESEGQTGTSRIRGSRPADNPESGTYSKQTVENTAVGSIAVVVMGHHVWWCQDSVSVRKGVQQRNCGQTTCRLCCTSWSRSRTLLHEDEKECLRLSRCPASMVQGGR